MIQDNTRMENDEIYFHLRRLPIFRHLSLGGEINENRNRPNIRKVSPPSTTALDIEKLFDKWESTREHYTDNVTKRRSKSDSNHPPQDEESLKNSMSRHLEACAAQVTRTFWLDQVFVLFLQVCLFEVHHRVSPLESFGWTKWLPLGCLHRTLPHFLIFWLDQNIRKGKKDVKVLSIYVEICLTKPLASFSN